MTAKFLTVTFTFLFAFNVFGYQRAGKPMEQKLTYKKIRPLAKAHFLPFQSHSSFNHVVEAMNQGPYDPDHLYAADQQDSGGRIQWEQVGQITYDKAILSAGVDKLLLFPHDTLNSAFTGERFEIPAPNKQYDQVPEDVQ